MCKVKTDYALILNPDIVCSPNFFPKTIKLINKSKNFSIIGCQYSNETTYLPAGFFDKKITAIMEYKSQFFDPNSNETKTIISSKEFGISA
mgnify:CR=1 FL=1